MKRSLLGAVGTASLVLSAHPARDGGEAAARDHRLDLKRGEVADVEGCRVDGMTEGEWREGNE